MNWVMRQWGRIIGAVLLAGLLTACGIGGGPGREVVQQAIALQLSQAQQALTQQLNPDGSVPIPADISRVKISSRQSLTIQDLAAYRVQGTYDVTLDFGNRRVSQQQNPFDLYLQRQPEAKTWRLARPEAGDGETSDRWVMRALGG